MKRELLCSWAACIEDPNFRICGADSGVVQGMGGGSTNRQLRGVSPDCLVLK